MCRSEVVDRNSLLKALIYERLMRMRFLRDLRYRRFDKTIRPKGDPDARLGVRFHFPNPKETRVDYFWGYRNHTVADLASELPLWEITEPNSVAETTLAFPLREATSEAFALPVQSVC